MKIKATLIWGPWCTGSYRWELTRGGERIGFYVCPKEVFWSGVRLPNTHF